MLKQATLFKDFKITTNADNTAVKFIKNGGLTVSVKNDNFAEQVQIQDTNGAHDFFDYKYITFDNEAVFEITDCMKNGNYSTLFIQYISNIKFDEMDTNFRVSALSVKRLQNLGLDINELYKILGNQFQPSREYFGHEYNAENPISYAIRLRFSELPQNLQYSFTSINCEVSKRAQDFFTGTGSCFLTRQTPTRPPAPKMISTHKRVIHK